MKHNMKYAILTRARYERPALIARQYRVDCRYQSGGIKVREIVSLYSWGCFVLTPGGKTAPTGTLIHTGALAIWIGEFSRGESGIENSIYFITVYNFYALKINAFSRINQNIKRCISVTINDC